MGTSSETPNESKRIQNEGQGVKGKKRDGLFTWMHTRMVKGKKWRVGKERKRKEMVKQRKLLWLFCGYLPSSPATGQPCLEWENKVTDHLTKLLSDCGHGELECFGSQR